MDTKAQYSHEQVLKVVEAKRSILEEVQTHLQQSGIRLNSITLMEEAIPWVAAELFEIHKPTLSLDEFIKEFKKVVLSRSRGWDYNWEYFSGPSEAHVGVLLSPQEKKVFFGLALDESGKHILRYRYIAICPHTLTLAEEAEWLGYFSEQQAKAHALQAR